jgi:hypothetical protein
MNDRPLGYLQRQMVSFIRRNLPLYEHTHCKAFSISTDTVSRRVATSLEKRDIVAIDRAFERWMIYPNPQHKVFN